ncbi:hypothetical protein PCE1_003834 [Barthelona sp. PCE]
MSSSISEPTSKHDEMRNKGIFFEQLNKDVAKRLQEMGINNQRTIEFDTCEFHEKNKFLMFFEKGFDRSGDRIYHTFNFNSNQMHDLDLRVFLYIHPRKNDNFEEKWVAGADLQLFDFNLNFTADTILFVDEIVAMCFVPPCLPPKMIFWCRKFVSTMMSEFSITCFDGAYLHYWNSNNMSDFFFCFRYFWLLHADTSVLDVLYKNIKALNAIYLLDDCFLNVIRNVPSNLDRNGFIDHLIFEQEGKYHEEMTSSDYVHMMTLHDTQWSEHVDNNSLKQFFEETEDPQVSIEVLYFIIQILNMNCFLEYFRFQFLQLFKLFSLIFACQWKKCHHDCIQQISVTFLIFKDFFNYYHLNKIETNLEYDNVFKPRIGDDFFSLRYFFLRFKPYKAVESIMFFPKHRFGTNIIENDIEACVAKNIRCITLQEMNSGIDYDEQMHISYFMKITMSHWYSDLWREIVVLHRGNHSENDIQNVKKAIQKLPQQQQQFLIESLSSRMKNRELEFFCQCLKLLIYFEDYWDLKDIVGSEVHLLFYGSIFKDPRITNSLDIGFFEKHFYKGIWSAMTRFIHFLNSGSVFFSDKCIDTTKFSEEMIEDLRIAFKENIQKNPILSVRFFLCCLFQHKENLKSYMEPKMLGWAGDFHSLNSLNFGLFDFINGENVRFIPEDFLYSKKPLSEEKLKDYLNRVAKSSIGAYNFSSISLQVMESPNADADIPKVCSPTLIDLLVLALNRNYTTFYKIAHRFSTDFTFYTEKRGVERKIYFPFSLFCQLSNDFKKMFCLVHLSVYDESPVLRSVYDSLTIGGANFKCNEVKLHSFSHEVVDAINIFSIIEEHTYLHVVMENPRLINHYLPFCEKHRVFQDLLDRKNDKGRFPLSILLDKACYFELIDLLHHFTEDFVRSLTALERASVFSAFKNAGKIKELHEKLTELKCLSLFELSLGKGATFVCVGDCEDDMLSLSKLRTLHNSVVTHVVDTEKSKFVYCNNSAFVRYSTEEIDNFESSSYLPPKNISCRLFVAFILFFTFVFTFIFDRLYFISSGYSSFSDFLSSFSEEDSNLFESITQEFDAVFDNNWSIFSAVSCIVAFVLICLSDFVERSLTSCASVERTTFWKSMIQYGLILITVISEVIFILKCTSVSFFSYLFLTLLFFLCYSKAFEMINGAISKKMTEKYSIGRINCVVSSLFVIFALVFSLILKLRFNWGTCICVCIVFIIFILTSVFSKISTIFLNSSILLTWLICAVSLLCGHFKVEFSGMALLLTFVPSIFFGAMEATREVFVNRVSEYFERPQFRYMGIFSGIFVTIGLFFNVSELSYFVWLILAIVIFLLAISYAKSMKKDFLSIAKSLKTKETEFLHCNLDGEYACVKLCNHTHVFVPEERKDAFNVVEVKEGKYKRSVGFYLALLKLFGFKRKGLLTLDCKPVSVIFDEESTEDEKYDVYGVDSLFFLVDKHFGNNGGDKTVELFFLMYVNKYDEHATRFKELLLLALNRGTVHNINMHECDLDGLKPNEFFTLLCSYKSDYEVILRLCIIDEHYSAQKFYNAYNKLRTESIFKS